MKRVLVAVGSRRDQVCSIGSFARAELESLKKNYPESALCEPSTSGAYPEHVEGDFDVVFFHAPSLVDRKKPWGAIESLIRLKQRYKNSKIISVVHEFSEAPAHWKIRQMILAAFSDRLIVNTGADQDGLRVFSKKMLYVPLGPTIFLSNFEEGKPEDYESRVRLSIAESLTRSVKRYQSNARFVSSQKRVLFSGLVTPGKGVDRLRAVARSLMPNEVLLIVGGVGPKEKDHRYFERVLSDLKSHSGQVEYLGQSTDDEYRDLLLASDLIVLPFDAGVSERRSSFLSAAACGGNILSTSGKFTQALRLESSGASLIASEAFEIQAPRILRELLNEAAEDQLKRRLHNLKWAQTRSWSKRIEAIKEFLEF